MACGGVWGGVGVVWWRDWVMSWNVRFGGGLWGGLMGNKRCGKYFFTSIERKDTTTQPQTFIGSGGGEGRSRGGIFLRGRGEFWGWGVGIS